MQSQHMQTKLLLMKEQFLCFSTLHPYMFVLNSYLYLDKGLGFCVTATLTCLLVCVYLNKKKRNVFTF